MTEQSGATFEIQVGDLIEVRDQWTGVTLKGKVTGLTSGGFYWEATEEDDYIMWTPYGGHWSVKHE